MTGSSAQMIIATTIARAALAGRLLLLLCCSIAATAAEPLPQSVLAALQRHGLTAESLSVLVEDARGRTIVEHNADDIHNPASVMKLVTTYAALDLLGPAFTWTTRLMAERPPTDGVLDGDLYWVGGGDPMILYEDFVAMLARLRQRGVTEIRGDLVIDDSLYDRKSIDRNPLDARSTRVYNVYPTASQVNFRATRFDMRPGAAGIEVTAEPPSALLRIDNALEAVDGPCRGLHRRVDMELLRAAAPARVRFSGRYPRSCGEHAITRTVHAPDDYLFGAFAATWRMLGGEIRGKAREGIAPDSAQPLLEHRSRPLLEVIAGTNKHSNNVMARSLLLTLGEQVHGRPASPETGRLAIRGWLNGRGLPMPTLIIDNGAGLSRDARLSPRDLARLLRDALDHPYREEFLASMSLTGVDGSTRERMTDTSTAGRYRIKTGLLSGVRAAAGYGLTERGTRLVIVIMQSSPKVSYGSGNAVQDAVLSWLHRSF